MTFRIATFNLENLGDGANDERDLAFRIEALRPQLMRLEADVLCLQEVNAQKEPAIFYLIQYFVILGITAGGH